MANDEAACAANPMECRSTLETKSERPEVRQTDG